ncbi:hypothetical protein [Candidatus Competibacter denitrificans]|uniref:hypothetical protein n=1 Tax=Candidatus Competibacter denitrificans TaxID=1400862 RepID=UPI0006605E01|nr:hypothetical protein [Candidatus Competibacter denitrificans]
MTEFSGVWAYTPLLQQLPESDRSRARLELLQLRLAASRRQPMNLLLEDQYRQRLLERLG